jgi:hypothetical protein
MKEPSNQDRHTRARHEPDDTSHRDADTGPDHTPERPEERTEDAKVMGGAVGAATGGAAIGGLTVALGPLGGLLGALAGIAGGWWAGEELVERVQEIDEKDNRFRHAHEHAGAERPYEEVRHAYQLGYLAARNPRYADRDFDDVEPDLGTAWFHAHQHEEGAVAWEHVRVDARRGFEVGRKET